MAPDGEIRLKVEALLGPRPTSRETRSLIANLFRSLVKFVEFITGAVQGSGAPFQLLQQKRTCTGLLAGGIASAGHSRIESCWI